MFMPGRYDKVPCEDKEPGAGRRPQASTTDWDALARRYYTGSESLDEICLAFGVTHGIFPIVVTVVAGVQNIKPILLRSAASMGASRWQIFRWVIFPHMIPSFFAGMRLGMTGVLLGVLLAELYVSTAGIGYFTTQFTQSFNPTKLLGLISVLAAIAIGLNEIVRRAEIRYSRWRTN